MDEAYLIIWLFGFSTAICNYGLVISQHFRVKLTFVENLRSVKKKVVLFRQINAHCVLLDISEQFQCSF